MVIRLSLSLKFMENWNCHRMDYTSQNGPHRHHHHGHHHHRSGNPSFSSAMLDAICKSTEEDGGMMAYKKSNSRQETRNVDAGNNTLMRNSSYKRVARTERQCEDPAWMNNNEKSMRGRSLKVGVLNAEKYEAEAAYSKHREFHLSFQSMSSATSCSSNYTNDSTSNCSYLSSDAESLYRNSSSIRTAKTEGNSHHVRREDTAWECAVRDRDLHGKSSVKDGYFRSTEKPFSPAEHAKVKSKSKSRMDSKKKPKHPISPGKKLASFLNSLFMAGGTKKPKLSSSSSSVSDSNSFFSSEKKPSSTYSSSSSVHSRPCLSKTSRGSKNSNGIRRSVTFYPTSVLINEESRPCGENCLHRVEKPAPNPNPPNYPHRQPSTNAYKLPLVSKGFKHRILEEDGHAAAAAAAAANIIGKYQQANSFMEAVAIRDLDKQDEEEEENDDDASCSSSDLFELENLTAFDMKVYQRELPVYETTHVETNKAIAKGLIV